MQIKCLSSSPTRAQELEREAHKFKAKEASVLRSTPFAPILPQKRLTVSQSISPLITFSITFALKIVIIKLQSHRPVFLFRDVVPVVQAPDLNTDRRALERGEFEVCVVAILVQKPWPPILYSGI